MRKGDWLSKNACSARSTQCERSLIEALHDQTRAIDTLIASNDELLMQIIDTSNDQDQVRSLGDK